LLTCPPPDRYAAPSEYFSPRLTKPPLLIRSPRTLWCPPFFPRPPFVFFWTPPMRTFDVFFGFCFPGPPPLAPQKSLIALSRLISYLDWCFSYSRLLAAFPAPFFFFFPPSFRTSSFRHGLSADFPRARPPFPSLLLLRPPPTPPPHPHEAKTDTAVCFYPPDPLVFITLTCPRPPTGVLRISCVLSLEADFSGPGSFFEPCLF